MLADEITGFRTQKTGALADAPVFSIIGRDFFSASLIFYFFLWYYIETFISGRFEYSLAKPIKYNPLFFIKLNKNLTPPLNPTS